MHITGHNEIDVILAFIASFAAGLVDSIAGGGGLILVPSLFSLFPSLSPATLFGTNKIASVSGTAMAALQYSRHIRLNWRIVAPAAILAWTGSAVGAWCVTHVNGHDFKKALPFILILVFLYTLFQKKLGLSKSKELQTTHELAFMCMIALGVGFYDGFFGPGTGSFLVFLMVRFLYYDFLTATAAAKILNTASNLSAIFLFSLGGHVWWSLGILMAISNMSGSLLGTRLAVKHGSGFVRKFFMFVVGALIMNSMIKAFF